MKFVSEVILWEKCLEGNQKAFEELYRRYYGILYNYGCKITADVNLVTDTIQNLFVKLLTNNKRLSRTQYVKAYVIYSFRNLLFDAFKKKGIITFYAEVSDEFLFANRLDLEEEIDMDVLVLLEEAYKELSPRQQEIIYLFYICNLSHKDISIILNINIQSSKNLLGRSISVMREIFMKKK